MGSNNITQQSVADVLNNLTVFFYFTTVFLSVHMGTWKRCLLSFCTFKPCLVYWRWKSLNNLSTFGEVIGNSIVTALFTFLCLILQYCFQSQWRFQENSLVWWFSLASPSSLYETTVSNTTDTKLTNVKRCSAFCLSVTVTCTRRL